MKKLKVIHAPDKNLKRASAAVSGATRYRPASYGGNWKGKEYLSQCEHDLLTRLTRLAPSAETRAMGVHGPITRDMAMEIVRVRRPIATARSAK